MRIKLDKGEYEIKNRKCVNSNFIARFLAKKNEEYCQCSFGECKIMVEIIYNGHSPRTYTLTEKEITDLPIIVEEIPQFEGTKEQLDNLFNMPIENNDTAGESLGVEELIEEFRESFPYKIGYVPATTHSQIPEYTCTHYLSKEAKIIESLIRKAYLAGALAHQKATRVEKEGCSRNHSPSNCTDCGFIEALDEITTKSEAFLNGLRGK